VYEDATFGLPAGPALQEQARRGEWRKVRERMAAETNAARRWRYASLAADGLAGAVAEWVEAEPDDVDAWLVAGMQAINRGAEIRGAAKADETPEENFDPFHECMEQAAAALQRAIELRPEDPLPRIPLLTVAMTLGAPIEERQALGEDALRHAPALVAAHVALMNALTKKWGGSHELMFESARRSVATAPARSAVAAVLPLAHVERWLYIQHWENDEARWRSASTSETTPGRPGRNSRKPPVSTLVSPGTTWAARRCTSTRRRSGGAARRPRPPAAEALLTAAARALALHRSPQREGTQGEHPDTGQQQQQRDPRAG